MPWKDSPAGCCPHHVCLRLCQAAGPQCTPQQHCATPQHPPLLVATSGTSQKPGHCCADTAREGIICRRPNSKPNPSVRKDQGIFMTCVMPLWVEAGWRTWEGHGSIWGNHTSVCKKMGELSLWQEEDAGSDSVTLVALVTVLEVHFEQGQNQQRAKE